MTTYDELLQKAILLSAKNAELRKALEKAMRLLDKISVDTDNMELVASICLLREMEFEPLLEKEE